MPDLTAEEVAEIRDLATTGFFGHLDVQFGPTILRLCDTIDHVRRELGAANGYLDHAIGSLKELEGKVLWRGKTGPMPGVDNERVSLITAEIPPGTEVAVVLTGEAESDG